MNVNTVSYWSSLLVLLILATGQKHQQLANSVKLSECKVDLFRLPTRIHPLNYELQLRVEDPREEFFIGALTIELSIREMMDPDDFLQSRTKGEEIPPMARDPRNIILNAEDLDVGHVEFYQDGRVVDWESICHDKDNKILVVTLGEAPSSETEAKLTFYFSGKVRDEAKGVFRSSIKPDSLMLATQLKPNYARQLFPCFDEPEFKAIIKLTIVHRTGTIALSNMPIIGEDCSDEGFTMTSYAPTPPISSYLLSFAVGDFDCITMDSIYGMPITIYTPMGWAESIRPMLKKSLQAYDMVNQFFEDIPLGLDKIDIVAVELEHTAMESLGLITMRWKFLSACAELSKPEDWNHAVVAIVNQMVRFWLGNLVTMCWWDDLWLIEGLANYLTSKLTTKMHQDINRELYTLIGTTFSAMNYDDDVQNAHPITDVNLKTVDKIQASYNSITYKKSEAIFRMFARFLGGDKFDWAIRRFVRLNAYKLVNADDFWNTLSNYAPEGFDMNEMGRQWTHQAGYPIITVSMVAPTRAKVSQESSLGKKQLWTVPISYMFYFPSLDRSFFQRDIILSERKMTISFPREFNLQAQNWLKFNFQYHGYYRVVYKSPGDLLMSSLTEALRSNQLLEADRMQLLSDSYAHGKQTRLMKHFEALLKHFPVDRGDGVMLLLTKILDELYCNDVPLALSEHQISGELIHQVENMMIKFYEYNGKLSKPAGSDVLNQCARGQVIFYLVNKLKNHKVIEEVRNFMHATGGKSSPFLKPVLDSLHPMN